MVSRGYEPVPRDDAEVPPTPQSEIYPQPTPPSPPPSFRSRASSPTSRRPISHGSTLSHVDQNLADAFGDESEDEETSNRRDDRQQLMQSSSPNSFCAEADPGIASGRMQRRVTELPIFTTLASISVRETNTNAPVATFSSSNDGVFANLNAKPEKGEKVEEQPPSYEQAAADATPPYWETTIMAPGMVSDEVYIDGLPLGSLFSFIWNAVISMSFQLVGFLLTYLLHTTHAAKNGSRAGLGITLVQYGFFMKGSSTKGSEGSNSHVGEPSNPNSHEFDPSTISDSAASAVAVAAGSGSSHGGGWSGSKEWLAYMLMIIGWFILIRSVTDYIRARRHEQLILQSPDRGLNVPVVMDGEGVENAV